MPGHRRQVDGGGVSEKATGKKWINSVRADEIKKVRAVPIDSHLETELDRHYHHHSPKIGDERFFSYAYSAFIEALDRTGIVLPAGQATHVMRHTFASHFMINGGNILVLQKILGHSSLAMTMRYAHLAPDHLNEARTLNPLTHWRNSGQNVDSGK